MFYGWCGLRRFKVTGFIKFAGEVATIAFPMSGPEVFETDVSLQPVAGVLDVGFG